MTCPQDEKCPWYGYDDETKHDVAECGRPMSETGRCTTCCKGTCYGTDWPLPTEEVADTYAPADVEFTQSVHNRLRGMPLPYDVGSYADLSNRALALIAIFIMLAIIGLAIL